MGFLQNRKQSLQGQPIKVQATGAFVTGGQLGNKNDFSIQDVGLDF